MASLYVLSCAKIIRCLSLCVFVCARAKVFVRCVPHCVTTARLVPSCFRGEGKTGRIKGGMSIGGGGEGGSTETTYVNKKETAAHGARCHDYHMLMKG